MAQLLRVLIVEDNPADAELLIRSLRHAGFETEWQRVDTEDAYRKRLHDPIDLVVSDYEMPQFTAVRALELLQQSGLDIPFIIVSGTIGEETAVKVMKLGAADYLLKDRLARLGPAIHQALEQSQQRQERRKVEAALRASDARFQGTLDRMLEGCQIIGHDWRYLYLNDTAAQHGHRTKDQLLGRTVIDCYPGVEKTDAFQVLRRCMTERKGARMENEFIYPDASKAWFELSIQPVPEGLFVLSLDVSGRKRADQKIREQLDELLRWQEVMIGREERVQALKTEVDELLAQQNRPKRYARLES